ncbi:tyrosine-type recombinase/integrase [Aquibium microcysteis]|uniref:tyrosine-type recombinase/integrase n=1 Tax=Aquibium microcysteis TaxID=675281 RepID=UPI00165D03EB|nr:site-specific integrase [Aquibium microcysteis]
MSVRKRTWTSPSGDEKTAWIVDYRDAAGARRQKTFARKKEADAYRATATVEVREGVHVADSQSATVAKAGDLWIASAVNNELERATLLQYRQHLKLHILPFIGGSRLSELNIPTVRAFEERLREEGRSPSMIRKVLVSLGSLLSDAQERGLCARNVVRDMRGKRKGKEARLLKRQKVKKQAGINIPANAEIKAIVAALEGRWRPLLLVAIFTGLRASELRGLRWADVDLDERKLHVRQRADRYNTIGSPKSEAGARAVPLPPIVLNTLKEWKLRSGGGELAFPNGKGNVESLSNIIKRGFHPAQIKAGVTRETGELDKEGKPILAAKYTGLHSLRHFFASWLINPPDRGGLGLPPKVVQERMGHSTIAMTMDTYGSLFPPGDDAGKLADAERALLS